MKFLRLSAALFAVSVTLAACGGGGGGGSSPVPNPGGGGNPSPGPGASATPKATATPAATPTPTATSTPNGVPVDANYTIPAEEDFGPAGSYWYTSGTASWANTAGDTATSAATGQGQGVGATFEGMTCADTKEGASFPQTAYSQHAFIGIYDSMGNPSAQYPSGLQALPQAIGMVNPIAPTQGTPSHPANTDEVEQYTCEYQVHTHDYSGLVHIEDVNLPQNTSYSYAPAYATLQTFLDEWGATLNSTGLSAGTNSLAGNVTIYMGTPSGQTSGNDIVTSYAKVTGAPSGIMLARHNAIWIVVGPLPAAGLPQVEFVVEN